jgi:hypothetical protein
MHYQQLLAAIVNVWDDTTAEGMVKRAAAQHLAAAQGHTATSSAVAQHVAKYVGKVSSLGIKQSFRQLLGGDPCFALHGATLDEALITLNVEQLLLQQAWKPQFSPLPLQQQAGSMAAHVAEITAQYHSSSTNKTQVAACLQLSQQFGQRTAAQ